MSQDTTGQPSAVDVMRCIMKRPPNAAADALLKAIAETPGVWVNSNTVKGKIFAPGTGYQAKRLGGIHSQLRRWTRRNCRADLPYKWRTGSNSKPSKYLMDVDVASVVLPPPGAE